MPPIPENIRCPATGFAKTCRAINAKYVCPKLVTLKGLDPQTGTVFDETGCVDAFLPRLFIENAQQMRQAGASVDKLRGEMKEARERADEARDEFVARVTGSAPARLASG